MDREQVRNEEGRPGEEISQLRKELTKHNRQVKRRSIVLHIHKAINKPSVPMNVLEQIYELLKENNYDA